MKLTKLRKCLELVTRFFNKREDFTYEEVKKLEAKKYRAKIEERDENRFHRRPYDGPHTRLW